MDTTSAIPSWTPTQRELDDLELLLDGVLTPLDGFVGGADLDQIRRDGTLPDGTPWRAEVTLSVPDGVAGGDALDLTDLEGTPIARLVIRDRRRLGSDEWLLAGPATPLQPREEGTFRDLRMSPAKVRARYPGERILSVPVDGPLDGSALGALREAAAQHDRMVLLPLVGTGRPRVVSAIGLVQTCLAAATILPGEPQVVPVPLATRGDPDVDGWLATKVGAAYGDEVFLDALRSDRLAPIAAALDEGGELPGDVPNEIAEVLRLDRPPRHRRGLTILFTGLSGSGKSTVARRVRDFLLERRDRTVTLLDGDVNRRLLSSGLGFSRADRETNIRRIGYVAAEVARHGGVALCAPIAPYASTRADMRRMAEDAGAGFVLVYVATPLAECERRDRKGLYARARAGEIAEFTGISDPYETPTDADLTLDTSSIEVDDAARQVMELLVKQGWLRSR